MFYFNAKRIRACENAADLLACLKIPSGKCVLKSRSRCQAKCALLCTLLAEVFSKVILCEICNQFKYTHS